MLTNPNNSRRFPVWAAALAAAVCAVVLLGAGLLFFLRRGLDFPQDAQLVVCRQADGSVLLSWPEIDQADGYEVQAVSGGETLLEEELHGPDCTLPALTGEDLTVKVRPVEGARKGAARTWTAENLAGISWPAVTSFEASVENKGTGIRFHWEGEGGEVFVLYQMDGTRAWPVGQSESDGFRLPVGGEDGAALPALGETWTFAAGYGLRQGDVVLCGPLSQRVELKRSDFLPAEIQLRAVSQGDNCYAFTWNEAQGDYYILQYCTEDIPEWTDLCRVEAAEEPGCKVKLASGTQERLRVIGVTEEEEILSQSEELEITTGLSALYATVWPIQDLDIYRDTQRQEVIGTAPAAAAFCVLGEAGGMFQIRTPDGYGYIDSNYCLINLPDYMGELCAYDITNSYSSRCAVHGYKIPGITGAVLSGYENVKTGEGQYLVPLLYPTAKKLASAAESARTDGCRLKLYDAYRPGQASRELYQVTMDHLYDPIPGEGADSVPAAPADSGAAWADQPSLQQAMTYGLLMTGGRYHPGSFLARDGSPHNLGIAVDVTLERLDTGEELEMQTGVHDLSQYAAVENNNENAALLAGYLEEAGFGPLPTEWWHFEDNDTRGTLGLTTYQEKGISLEGWHQDLTGWYYCRRDGSRIREETVELEGETWQFDADGYAHTPETPES